MKLHFFGTCAGTEPMPGRKHVSFAVEVDGGVYWFDAGEGCSYTAHLMGVDLLAVRKIFISHPHMDHVGGLGNLLWNIRKMRQIKNRLPAGGAVDLYIPNTETWDGIYKILKNTEENFVCDFAINTHPVRDGTLFENEQIKITAAHNRHLSSEEGSGWCSFSYLIEAQAKKLVFSGDVRSIADLEPFLKDGCDVLLMETGHHKITEICGYLENLQNPVKNLFFIHNGREILQDREGAFEKAARLFSGHVHICEDSTSFDL